MDTLSNDRRLMAHSTALRWLVLHLHLQTVPAVQQLRVKSDHLAVLGWHEVTGARLIAPARAADVVPNNGHRDLDAKFWAHRLHGDHGPSVRGHAPASPHDGRARPR